MRKPPDPRKRVKSDAASAAKQYGAPHIIPVAPPEPPKSRLFDPVVIEIRAPKKAGPVRSVPKGTFHSELPLRKGEMNRPDKSEQRNNLTFNWQ